jgi:hypothetical protein
LLVFIPPLLAATFECGLACSPKRERWREDAHHHQIQPPFENILV